MKYIGFNVKPVDGKPLVVIRKLRDWDKVSLNHTWNLRDYRFSYHLINADITSFAATRKDYMNQQRQFNSPLYAKVVALLR